jgi:hypothetical protein
MGKMVFVVSCGAKGTGSTLPRVRYVFQLHDGPSYTRRTQWGYRGQSPFIGYLNSKDKAEGIRSFKRTCLNIHCSMALTIILRYEEARLHAINNKLPMSSIKIERALNPIYILGKKLRTVTDEEDTLCVRDFRSEVGKYARARNVLDIDKIYADIVAIVDAIDQIDTAFSKRKLNNELKLRLSKDKLADGDKKKPQGKKGEKTINSEKEVQRIVDFIRCVLDIPNKMAHIDISDIEDLFKFDDEVFFEVTGSNKKIFKLLAKDYLDKESFNENLAFSRREIEEVIDKMPSFKR